MTPIGGFFELELNRSFHVWHRDALALTSGRACLRAILEITCPSRVLVPFYICDAALLPLQALGISCEFYGLTPSLDPDVTSWPDDAAVLYVNYFDLKGARASRIAGVLGARAIVDDTQAFFRRGYDGAWSFNSARKFFGVPDGAYAYGPGIAGVGPVAANTDAPIEHLTTRLMGHQDRAYKQYLEAEAQVCSEVLAPSPLGDRLLGGIAYDEARAARRRNFAQLHEKLGAANRLSMDFTLDADAGPSCYPFLPPRPALHEALWRREIFVPRLWPDLASRPGSGFDLERDLAVRMLPLPVDHRYGCDDMARVIEAVLEVAG